MGRQGPQPPAGGGRAGGASRRADVGEGIEQGIPVGVPPQATEHDARGAPGLRGQLQAAGGGEVQAVDLADHGPQGRAAEAFLHGPKHRGAVTPPDQEQPSRWQTQGG
jgi:hypothetical protein